jgi:hypothetical protein
MSAIGRNAPCTCGSGKKYKHCCALKTQKMSLAGRITISVIGLMLLTGAIFMLTSLNDVGYDSAGPQRVRSAEHQHWH